MSMQQSISQLQKMGVIVAKRGKNKKETNSDLSITITDKTISIVFRNCKYELFEERVSFIQFPDGRALFIVSDEEGYKLVEKKTKNNRYITIDITTYRDEAYTLLAANNDWSGDYDLKFDENTGWYYIKK